MKITEKVGTALFLLFMLFLAVVLIWSGNHKIKQETVHPDPTPSPIATTTPTATPSATPVVRENRTPERVIITQPQAGGSAQPQSAPQPAPVTNNNTTIVQPAQPTQAPAPQPTPQPQPTQSPGIIENVLDSVRNIL